MNKKIFIINGSGGVGKDTFVELVSEFVPTKNISSVDKIKEIARLIGWDGESKTEKDRKFLSDLKLLTSNYCDMPFQYMKEQVENFNNSKDLCLFLHIREPEEIERAVKEFNAETILITRSLVEQIKSNMADANVFNYKNYNYIINNDGTIEDLKKAVECFIITLRKE